MGLARHVQQLARLVLALALCVGAAQLHLTLVRRDRDAEEVAEDDEELRDDRGRDAEVGDDLERGQVDGVSVVALHVELLDRWHGDRLVHIALRLGRRQPLAARCQLLAQLLVPRLDRARCELGRPELLVVHTVVHAELAHVLLRLLDLPMCHLRREAKDR